MLVSKQTETFEHASANESSELQTLALWLYSAWTKM